MPARGKNDFFPIVPCFNFFGQKSTKKCKKTWIDRELGSPREIVFFDPRPKFERENPVFHAKNSTLQNPCFLALFRNLLPFAPQQLKFPIKKVDFSPEIWGSSLSKFSRKSKIVLWVHYSERFFSFPRGFFFFFFSLFFPAIWKESLSKSMPKKTLKNAKNLPSSLSLRAGKELGFRELFFFFTPFLRQLFRFLTHFDREKTWAAGPPKKQQKIDFSGEFFRTLQKSCFLTLFWPFFDPFFHFFQIFTPFSLCFHASDFLTFFRKKVISMSFPYQKTVIFWHFLKTLPFSPHLDLKGGAGKKFPYLFHVFFSTLQKSRNFLVNLEGGIFPI